MARSLLHFFVFVVIPTHMKIFKIVIIVLFIVTWGLPIYSQENTVVLKWTPEQEAAKQTEKLQLELDLNQSQANQLYEINLRYARERQISNTRSEALERTRNKNAEIKQILSPEQNDRLQSKRFERTYIETHTLNQNQYNNSTVYRTSPVYRSNQPTRIPATTDRTVRSNFRPVNPNFHPREGSYQTMRRSTPNITRTYQYQNNRTATRPMYSNPRLQSISPSRK